MTRVAILGMGAIGSVVRRALDGRVDLVEVDRTKRPLRGDEAPVDVAVVTTKTFGTAWAAEQAARLLDHGGVALTIQNGLGNYETLAKRLGEGRVEVGVIWVGAQLRDDGSLFATGPGRVDIGRSSRLDALAAAMEGGGMTVTRVDDPWRAVWTKLVANAAMNATTALFRCTNGELLAHPAGAPLADELAREVARVATARGVAIADDAAVAQWRGIADRLGANRSSMLQDVEAGRPTEVAAINGAVADAGEAVGVPAPTNRAMALLVSALRPA
ncbi:MAG TPA: 2-dehydropantoate 2-reductase [Candidatus Limnocylindria bacterium]|nr:2-dehydropantoate 2-reductase [Candidatus Limnocylindria bacterium]